MARVPNTVCAITLVLTLLASSAFAGQAPVSPTPPTERYHPYKKAGLIMMGIGALVSVAALQRVGGLEGIDFQTCVAGAATAAAPDACADQRLPNPTLTAVGVFLMGGGGLLALQRATRTRTPEIRFGPGRVAVVSGFSF